MSPFRVNDWHPSNQWQDVIPCSRKFFEKLWITSLTVGVHTFQRSCHNYRSRHGFLFEKFYYQAKISRPEFVRRLLERLRSLKTDALWLKIVPHTTDGKTNDTVARKLEHPSVKWSILRWYRTVFMTDFDGW